MRIVEILLPKGAADRSLSPQQARKIDALQTRMDGYVDKIMNPGTSSTAKEFLKSKLRTDYNTLRDEINHVMETSDIQTTPAVQYEVYDKQTKLRAGGPYSTPKRARTVRDKKDMEYGAYRYGVRPVGGEAPILEAINKLPLSNKDFELVKKMMENPIPAVIAPIYIMEIIEDDELNDQLRSLEESEPGLDVRPLIAEWFNRVMPDQMYRFGQAVAGENMRKGILSPIHGYDPKMYKGSNDPVGGNAYGMF